MANDDGRRGVGELLAGVAANVAVVPVVLGFVALGGVVLASRALADIAVHARKGPARKRPSRKGRRADGVAAR